MITIELPWPDKRLSPNARVHWREKAKMKKLARNDGIYYAHQAPNVYRRNRDAETYEAQYMFYPPDRRKRNIDNCIAMMKAAQDGVCLALAFMNPGYEWSTAWVFSRFAPVITHARRAVSVMVHEEVIPGIPQPLYHVELKPFFHAWPPSFSTGPATSNFGCSSLGSTFSGSPPIRSR